MKPVRTADSNLVYGGPTPEIGDLWVERTKESAGTVIYAVFEPSDAERELLAAGGRVHLGIVGEPIPPVSVNVLSAEDSAPVGDHGFKIPPAQGGTLGVGICRECGCTNDDPCRRDADVATAPEKKWTCGWADDAHTLCSACKEGREGWSGPRRDHRAP